MFEVSIEPFSLCSHILELPEMTSIPLLQIVMQDTKNGLNMPWVGLVFKALRKGPKPIHAPNTDTPTNKIHVHVVTKNAELFYNK